MDDEHIALMAATLFAGMLANRYAPQPTDNEWHRRLLDMLANQCTPQPTNDDDAIRYCVLAAKKIAEVVENAK